VEEITFERPAYLKVLAVVLVVLIAVSATMALFTREVSDLTLGIGGLILGVWGIRSILMPQGLSTVTAIDLALSWLILLLLLGLALRAALHFLRHSELSLPRPRQFR
jgi:FtsH-binding integral membrane protein